MILSLRLHRAISGLGILLSAVGAVAASRPAVEAEHAMVVSEQHLAADAGLAILRQGGNAIDAAVAVGYALAVTHPCCGNIGGGGFMLIHLKDGSEKVIDFRETAPMAASRDMYLDAAGNPIKDASLQGWTAVAVPGTVAGFESAESAFGRLGRQKVMAPAIKLARDGFLLTRGDTDITVDEMDVTVGEFYQRALDQQLTPGELPLDTDLRDIFNVSRRRRKNVRAAVDLLRENRKVLVDKVNYWTGVQRPLVKKLVETIETKVSDLGLRADIECEREYLTEVTVYATALAMNYITRGKFILP